MGPKKKEEEPIIYVPHTEPSEFLDVIGLVNGSIDQILSQVDEAIEIRALLDKVPDYYAV